MEVHASEVLDFYDLSTSSNPTSGQLACFASIELIRMIQGNIELYENVPRAAGGSVPVTRPGP